MAGLPKLPGFNFTDPTVSIISKFHPLVLTLFAYTFQLTKFHLSQTFNLCNGYKLPKNTYVGIGGRKIASDSVKYLAKYDSTRYDPSLTYGRTRSKPVGQFLPQYVLYAQKCLTFNAFFKQAVVESPNEFYRVRQVNIIYFLEDDTITVIEPRVPVSNFVGFEYAKSEFLKLLCILQIFFCLFFLYTECL